MDGEGGFVFQLHDEADVQPGTVLAGSWTALLMQQYDCSVFKKQLTLVLECDCRMSSLSNRIQKKKTFKPCP